MLSHRPCVGVMDMNTCKRDNFYMSISYSLWLGDLDSNQD